MTSNIQTVEGYIRSAYAALKGGKKFATLNHAGVAENFYASEAEAKAAIAAERSAMAAAFNAEMSAPEYGVDYVYTADYIDGLWTALTTPFKCGVVEVALTDEDLSPDVACIGRRVHWQCAEMAATA